VDVTNSTSSKILSVSATCFAISVASFFKLSKLDKTLSSSRMYPVLSFKDVSKDFSKWWSLYWNSPCIFKRSLRFNSISGLSDLRKRSKHCKDRLPWVIVKLTKETRLEISGEKCWEEFLVIRNKRKLGEKSISLFPTRTKFLPPLFLISFNSIGFIMQSYCSASCIRITLPKRNALSSVFKKEASRKLVTTIFWRLW